MNPLMQMYGSDDEEKKKKKNQTTYLTNGWDNKDVAYDNTIYDSTDNVNPLIKQYSTKESYKDFLPGDINDSTEYDKRMKKLAGGNEPTIFDKVKNFFTNDSWKTYSPYENLNGDKNSNYTPQKSKLDTALENNPVYNFLNNLSIKTDNALMPGSAPLKPKDQGAIADKITDIGSGLLSFAAPIPGIQGETLVSAASKFAKPLEEKAVNKLGASSIEYLPKLQQYGVNAARTGLEFGGINALQSATNGDDLMDIAKSSGEGFATGALMGTLGKGISEELIPRAFPKWNTTYESKTVESPLSNNPIQTIGYKEELIPKVVVKREPIKNAIDTIPMSERDFSNIGDKTIKAYQQVNTDVKPLIQSEANILKGELERTIPATKGANYSNGEYIPYSNQRITSDSIAAIKDVTGASYNKINTAIDNIVKDHGAENNALSKKVELILDDRLTNGYYDDITGAEIPPNVDYILKKANFDETYNKPKTTPIFSGYETNKIPINPSLEPLKLQSNANIPLDIKPPLMSDVKPIGDILKTNTEVASTLTPKLGSGQFNVSELKTNTMRNAPMFQTKETQNIIDDIAAQYEVKPNAQSINRATKELETNFDNVMNRISNNGIQTAEDAVSSGLISRELRQQAEQTGDYTQLKSWLETVQPKVTDLAQSLQALSTWKKLSPEGALMKAQQVVGKVNRDGIKEFGSKFKKVELTNDEMKSINDIMANIQTMEDGRAKDIEFAKVKQIIADKIPPTLSEKVKALQRISLLLNPKTNVRNVLGNTILGGLENIKDIPGSLIDKAVSLKTGERTTLLPSLEGITTQGKGLFKGAKETIQDAKLGINTNPSAGQFDLPPTQVFKKGVLNKLEKATNTTLEFGDRPFYQAAYDEALRQQLKINKATEPTKTMMDNAKAVAEERTLQNVSSLVNGFKNIQSGLNHLTGNRNLGIGNAVLPFTKTPANILDKAIDYSPIGSIKALTQLISKKEFNQKAFVDRIGRSLTGTSLIALGYDLARNGLLTGNSNKDKDVAALEKQIGKTPYSFKIGNTYRTFDWAQPAAIPLAIGADIFHQGKNTKERDNIIIEAIKSGGNTLFQQSLLQGLQRLFGGYNTADSISNSLKGIPTQFVPTALKQVAQLTDSNMRDTYSSSATDKMVNDIKSRIPGLSTTLQPKIDTMGREVKQFNGNNNPFNVLINPGYTNKYNPSNAEKLALNLYNETGSTTQFPRVASDKITYKESKDKNKTIQLTPQEKVELQTYIGQETNKAYDFLYNLDDFNNKTSKDKIKELEKALREIYDKGEQQILRGRGINEYKAR